MREPESYTEAAKDANWRTAMEEEMHALTENETWDLVDVPKGVKSIGCNGYTRLNTTQILHQQVQDPGSGQILRATTRHRLQ